MTPIRCMGVATPCEHTGFWEMNQGIVDEDGHWRPIYSTGHDGIDCEEWYDRKIESLKADLGYDIRPPQVQYDEKMRDAVRKVFGDNGYYLDTRVNSDPRVVELMKDEKKKLDEFRRGKKEYVAELQHRHDQMFMQALERDNEEERPSEVGLLDDEHIKETCRDFCESYSGNVGMMVNVLDRLSEMGYDAWCTCSDCGEQFQTANGPFLMNIDEGSYTGNGGIGVIMKRVMCDECMEASRCEYCGEYDIPNRNKKDGGASDWANYDFLACLLYDWIGVCWGCADGFERDKLEKFDEGGRVWRKTEAGERLDAYRENFENHYGLEDRELYEEMKKTAAGRKRINDVRDELQGLVEEHFEKSHGYEFMYMDRLDVMGHEQDELPGVG